MSISVFHVNEYPMNESHSKEKKRSTWKVLKDSYRKTISVVRDFQVISWLVGLALLYGISDVLVFGLQISKWMQQPLTERIIPITPIFLLLSVAILVLTYHLHKFKTFNKTKYIKLSQFIWRIQINKDNYIFKPLCKTDYTELNHHMGLDIIIPVYYYKCEECEHKYTIETINSEKHILKSKIKTFGINHFKNDFINMKK